jgi:hypothetical protein
MIIIKEEYLDIKIACPGTRKEILVRFIPVELYSYYESHGYDFLFEEVVTINDKSLPVIDEDEFLSVELIKKINKI